MTKDIVQTDKAPAAVGPYSQAIKAGGFLFTSGQIALIPGTKNLVQDSIESETRQVLNNLKAVVEAAGSSLEKAVKMTVFMTNIDNYGQINQIYNEFFENSKPARAAVEVSNLPLGARVEIEGIFEI